MKAATPQSIREWREAKNLNRAEAGRLIGVRRQTWAAWELSQKPIRLGVLIAIALAWVDSWWPKTLQDCQRLHNEHMRDLVDTIKLRPTTNEGG